MIGAVHSGVWAWWQSVCTSCAEPIGWRITSGLEHFDKLGKLLVVMTLSLAYLYFAEQLTVWYGRIPDHVA